MQNQDVTSLLKFDDKGLITAVVQDASNGEVLMVAYMDAEAVRRTLESGRTCFYSRSRQTYWVKGETSGHVQHVREVRTDCDRDCLVVKVDQTGAACHEGFRSCFAHIVSPEAIETVEQRLTDPY
jgi:phosphoribosyl-AMP cyclohydrolase